MVKHELEKLQQLKNRFEKLAQTLTADSPYTNIEQASDKLRQELALLRQEFYLVSSDSSSSTEQARQAANYLLSCTHLEKFFSDEICAKRSNWFSIPLSNNGEFDKVNSRSPTPSSDYGALFSRAATPTNTPVHKPIEIIGDEPGNHANHYMVF